MKAEREESGKIKLWMKLIFPNETPHDVVIERSMAIAEYKYDGVEMSEDDAIEMGTIVEFPIRINGVKEPKKKEDLSFEETQVNTWQDEYLEDVEIEGDY